MARVKIERVVEYYDPQKDVYGRAFQLPRKIYYVLVLKSFLKKGEYLLLHSTSDRLHYKVQLCANPSDATTFNNVVDAKKMLEMIKNHPKWYIR